jgi:hypothetical protein
MSTKRGVGKAPTEILSRLYSPGMSSKRGVGKPPTEILSRLYSPDRNAIRFKWIDE